MKVIISIWMVLLITACNKWEDHNAITDPKLNDDLFQQIQGHPNLSRFAELLVQSGYDKVIASSQNYTVFAPVNEALSSLDQAVINDSARLRLFIGNHIANQLQTVGGANPVRLLMVNGKYNNLLGHQFDEATITAANSYSKNGLLHVIDKMVPALNNAWEFVQNDPSMPAHQKNFMLNHTDSAGANVFLTTVHDLRNEQKQFTFFVLSDTSWDKEVTKYKPFFITGTADSTTNAAGQAVVNDFAIEGLNPLPDTILSTFNTKIGIDKSAIVRTIKLSNGIAYVMSKLDVLPRHKFQPFVIQGEQYEFSRLDRRNQTYLRDKHNRLTGQDFRDVLVYDHGVANFYLGYRLRNVPSLKYRAYWVALNDSIGNVGVAYRQLLGIDAPTSNLLPFTTVNANVFDEILLGEFTLPAFRPVLNVYLTADNNTNRDQNKITVDYIRLEPVL